ncbi:THO complex subunit 5-like [Hondaea fermentalgiana]|uniref:THO complex subunit 5-like n=1 Tax=Hondaea fermentalgiana TaxID=2315210 RepID=A0A2R5GMG2_9STRA|nr:THO complex subunit 5-like [Hondaea fermentalgiana]|eukprot:GBG29054.1 THO complex subunit 5-like [Hondaea fermentalgiana]
MAGPGASSGEAGARETLVSATGRLGALGERLRHLAREAAAAKKHPPAGDDEQGPATGAAQKKAYAEGCVAIMELKRRSREAFCAAAGLLEQLDAAKKSAEDRQLSLQNLLYEKAYLRREIERCRKFELTENAKIDLVSRADFEASASESLLKDIRSLPEGSQEQAHKVSLCRLSHELQLRRDLQNRLRTLRESVQSVKETTSDRLAFLDELPRKMQDIVKATKPVQEHFGDRVIDRLARHELCRELPEPLYMIYCQLEAYGDSFGGVGVSVAKDQAAVARLAAAHISDSQHGKAEKGSQDEKDDDDDEEDDDDDDEEEEATAEKTKGNFKEKKKKKGSRGSANVTSGGAATGDKEVGDPMVVDDVAGSGPAAKKRRLSGKADDAADGVKKLQPVDGRPLVDSGYSVLAKLESPNRQIDVSLVFKFYPALKVVTVEAENRPGLLANIYPNDTGQFLPRASLDTTAAQGARKEFPEDLPDRPYKWLQWLAGSYNLPPEGPGAEAQPSMGSIVQSILERVGAQEALSEQLHALKKCPHPVPVHPSAEGLFPSKATTRLVKWEEMTEAEADDRITSTQVARASGAPIFHRRREAATSSAWTKFGRRCFHGVMETTDKNRVEAVVQVFVDYPQRAPHFTLLPTSNSTLRIIQTEVNDHADELRAADQLRLLSHQLRRLQMCLDVMTSSSRAVGQFAGVMDGMDEITGDEPSASSSERGSSSATASKMDRKLRGRDRRLAFVYDPPSRSFTHR